MITTQKVCFDFMYTAIPHDVCDAMDIVFGPLHHYLLAAIGTGLPACPGAYPGCQARKNAVTCHTRHVEWPWVIPNGLK